MRFLKSFKDHIELEKIKENNKDVIDSYKIFSNQKLLLFVSSGRVFTIEPNILPTGKSHTKKFIYFIDSMMNDKLIKVLPYSKNLKTTVVSSKGKGFIASLNDILTSQKKGKKLFNLKSHDSLLKVIEYNANYIACIKKMFQAPQYFYSQCATHNAYSVAIILTLVDY